MDNRPSDETLLVAVAERDMGAFRTLYERHAGWLAIRLARRCNDRDLVADAIQDTFVAVWQKPRGFRGDGDIAHAVSFLASEGAGFITASTSSSTAAPASATDRRPGTPDTHRDPGNLDQTTRDPPIGTGRAALK